MAGTFVIRPTNNSVINSGTWSGGPSGTWTNRSESDLVAGINSATSSPTVLACGKLLSSDPDANIGDHSVTFSLGTTVWELDGNPAVDINGLPTGFTPTLIGFVLENGWGLNSGTLFLKILGVEYPQPLVNGGAAYTFSYDITTPLIDLESQFGLRVTFDDFNAIAKFFNWRIAGNYSIESFIQNNPNNPTNPKVFQPGVDTITISSPNPPDLKTVTEVHIVDKDNKVVKIIPDTDFIIWLSITLSFLLPDLPDNPPWIPGPYTLIGVTFSGSVTLGSLYILLENGSGIYSIVSGKTSDTIYINSPSNNQTMDFSIPNPFFKTGLIGG